MQLATWHIDYMNINFASIRIDFVHVFVIPEREQVYSFAAHGGISIITIVTNYTDTSRNVTYNIREHETRFNKIDHRKLIFV